MIELTLTDGDIIELDSLDETDVVESVASNDTGIPDGLILRYIETGNVRALQEYIDVITNKFTPLQVTALLDADFSFDTITEHVDEITTASDSDEWLDNNEDWIFDGFIGSPMYDFVRDALDPDELVQRVQREGLEILSDGTVIDYSSLI